MNTTDKKAVAKAKQTTKTGKKRSLTNAEQGLDNVQGQLNQARQKVRESTKAFIVGGGISDAIADIANGDYGEIGNEAWGALNTFIDGIDQTRLTLEASESDPTYFLPSASSCTEVK